MISNILNIKKARELRLAGKSLSEISRELNISKSTLSQWLKDIALNDHQLLDLKNRTRAKMSRGRLNASISLRSARIFKEKRIYEEAEKEFSRLSKEPFFMLGLGLYWAHGSKKGGSFQFSSSDPHMIRIMIVWLKKYLKLEDGLVKERNYGGYLRIDVTRVAVLRRVLAWQKLLMQYYGKVI